ncbi:MAG TPA: DM13 domain-containing protein [Nitrososphaeraceae archaeon]|nr:DM13 domain-containing protein [Nitrososphaeraceae archaeon]
MNKKILIAIIIIVIVVALAIPFAIYTISPLFISNTVNEPLPTTAAVTNNKVASQEYQKFISMNEQDRINAAKEMNQRQKNMVMIGAAQVNNTMNENVGTSLETINKQQQQQQTNTTTTNAASTAIKTGSFIGAGDGFHNAEGLAKVIQLEGGRTILRLENFKSTNGPNVHLYLAADKAASNFIDLGRLKANNGNQNYNIPAGTDLNKQYNMALIWCKDFSVLFGSAQLKS